MRDASADGGAPADRLGVASRAVSDAFDARDTAVVPRSADSRSLLEPGVGVIAGARSFTVVALFAALTAGVAFGAVGVALVASTGTGADAMGALSLALVAGNGDDDDAGAGAADDSGAADGGAGDDDGGTAASARVSPDGASAGRTCADGVIADGVVADGVVADGAVVVGVAGVDDADVEAGAPFDARFASI